MLLAAYSTTLEVATDRVRSELGLAPTSRVKNTGTILEKLERYGGSWLKSIQDLGGMRIVRRQTRREQDALVEALVQLFSGEVRAPKVVDRRVDPAQGYRAVHVIVFPDGFPLEIQVRTRWQHEWAELFEKLADKVGREIRYGEPVRHWLLPDERANLEPDQKVAYEDAYELRAHLVEQAIIIADLIDATEGIEHLAPELSDIGEFRDDVAEALSLMRKNLDSL